MGSPGGSLGCFMPQSWGWRLPARSSARAARLSRVRRVRSRDCSACVTREYRRDAWLLDEGDSEVLRDLCRSLGVRHLSRQGMPFYQAARGAFASRSKLGNYNAWLQEIGFENYDILIAFDPDHVPVPEYASAVLGFFEGPQVAYVQAPQVYRNQSASLVALRAAEETDAYYSAAEMASYRIGENGPTRNDNVHR